MSGIFLTKEFWVVLSTVLTLLASVYATYLSKRARKEREQKAIIDAVPEQEKVQQLTAEQEVTHVDESIRKQEMAENNFFSNPLPGDVWYQACKASYNYGLDHTLIAAIIQIESSGNRYAMRFEPDWGYISNAPDFAKQIGSSIRTEEVMQSTSWGVMQVMGTVARELGHQGWLSELCDLKTGIDYGCKHLKAKIQLYGLPDGIAAYNAGSPRKNDKGRFINQAYVDKILEYQKNFLAVTKPPIG